MKKHILLFTALLSLSGMAHANRTITAISVSPTEAKQNENVTIYIKTTGSGACNFKMTYTGPSNATNNFLIDSTTTLNGYAIGIGKAFEKPGTYKLKAQGDNQRGDCLGSADSTIHITRRAIKFGTTSAPMACPTGYDHFAGSSAGSSPTELEKGVAFCIKQKPTCPSGLFPNFNNQTGILICSANVSGECAEGWIRADAQAQLSGRLVCKPKVPEIVCPPNFNAKIDTATNVLTCTPIITAPCPDGWTGSAAEGKLVCNSKPQPMVMCPTTEQWEWGTKYYKESWNKMGCFENGKIAY